MNSHHQQEKLIALHRTALSLIRRAGRSVCGLICSDGWRPLLALALLAATIQAAFLASTEHVLLFRFPLIDATTYHTQAVAILAGKDTPGAFWQAPLYPSFLSLLERLCGGSPSGARWLQALLLAPLLSVLTWLMSKRFLPLPWAFSAALACTLTGPLFFHASQLLPAALAAVLVTATLLLAMRALERPSGWKWLATGATAGLATVTVATAAALLPVLACAAAFSQRTAYRKGLLHVVSLGLGLALPLLPVSLHNFSKTGQWVWVSTNGGINLYIGNSASWPAPLCVLPGLDWDKLVRQPFIQGGARDDVAASRWFRQQAWREIGLDPAKAAKRLAFKSAAFWHGREIPRNIDVYGWRKESFLLQALIWRTYIYFPSGLLVPLAVVGLLSLRSRQGALLAASLVSFGLLVALFFPCSRYRVPVLPTLVILSTYGLFALISAIRTRRFQAATGLAAAFLLTAIPVNLPLRWPTDALRYDAHLLHAIGSCADVLDGDLNMAKNCHEAAALMWPGFADAYFELGTVCARLGEPNQAHTCYEAALAARPDHDKAQVNLALSLAQRGKITKALDHLIKAETSNPLNAKAWFNHGALLARAGRPHEALPPLKRASELDRTYRADYERLLHALNK
jgi:hypothetical protein